MERTTSGFGLPLLALVIVGATTTPFGRVAVGDDEPEGLGPPASYEALREATFEPAGRIRDGRLRVDRFEFELTDGDLYLLAPVEGRVTGAVYFGEGLVRGYPPDGVEHHQVERFLDEDYIEEDFDRMVLRFTDDTADRLRELADGSPGRDAKKATDLLEDRREELLEKRLENLDSRVLVDLLSPPLAAAGTSRRFFHAEIDADDGGWFTVEVEPRVLEEVRVYRVGGRQNIADFWMGAHALSEFSDDIREQAFVGFPRDPDTEGGVGDADDDNDWDARDLGLSSRTLYPDREAWEPRVRVDRSDVDLALEGDGDAKASVALVIEPLLPLTSVRVRVSPVLEVTDVRWRHDVPSDVEDVRTAPLLMAPLANGESTGDEASLEPDEPAPLSGEPLHYVQAVHNRWLEDDRYEPWLTVALPRRLETGERFVLELAYEGELVERLRPSRDLLLKDTVFWVPRHMDSRGSRMNLTFRVPERYRIASGGDLVDERVEDDTRIMRWVSDEPVRSMSFNYGQFEVDRVEADDLPSVEVYASENHLGFAPGNREKTIDDLSQSIRTYREYFGAYPYDSLLVTETPTYSGQAFPGLVLLSFATFGELHTGEAELFRAHEVAHQWWGAAVDWESYRDQWISEGFAQYAAALFTLNGLDEEEQFLDMLEAWRLDVLSVPSIGQGLGLRHYGFRPEVIQRSDGHESGPLVLGYRLQSSDTPMDYRLLVYEKGAFILHMLRMMLMDLETGDDTRFRELMRAFVDDHLHGVASTRSFEAAVTQAFGEPMTWFFDQWVYGVDVPTYRSDLEVSRLVDQDAPYLLHGTIRQEEVPEDFRMPVPIMVRFDGRAALARRVWVDAGEVEVEIPLPAEPTDINVNYHHGVLARLR